MKHRLNLTAPQLFNCGHVNPEARYQYCPTCGFQLIDHGCAAADTRAPEHVAEGPTFERVDHPCLKCQEPTGFEIVGEP